MNYGTLSRAEVSKPIIICKVLAYCVPFPLPQYRQFTSCTIENGQSFKSADLKKLMEETK